MQEKEREREKEIYKFAGYRQVYPLLTPTFCELCCSLCQEEHTDILKKSVIPIIFFY